MRGITVADGFFRTVLSILLFISICLPVYASEAKQFEKGLNAYNQGDYQAAYELILPIAADGDPSALNLLGLMYESGLGVKKDTGRSVNYYRQAAEKGYPYAQYNLAVSYDTGIGVTLNYREAVKWYQRAAMQGTSIAQYNLGVMYEEGRGVSKDFEKAAYWYRKAATQGYSQAQNNLAWLYEKGKGLKIDLIHAYAWFDIAAEQGIETAGQRRDLIEHQLDKKEIIQAKNAAKELKAMIANSNH